MGQNLDTGIQGQITGKISFDWCPSLAVSDKWQESKLIHNLTTKECKQITAMISFAQTIKAEIYRTL